MLLLALLACLMPVLALQLRETREAADPGRPALRVPVRTVARVAGGDRSFWLLNFGFATCGFQLAFVATYVPAIVADSGLAPALGAGVLAAIGAFNILGTYLAGLAGARWRKKYVLSWLYVARAGVFLAFVAWPASPASVLLFGAAMGLMWTGTVPLTSGLTGDLYGHRNLGFLFGLVYVGHQMGAFLGAWAGGFAFDRTGSFDIVWALCIGLSLLAALLHAVLDDAPRPLALAEAGR
jgi:predicted MFS family arabinose efflux permease